LAEIVEHGRTGFLVDDEAEMADAILAAGDLDSDICRETARRRFSLEHMVAAYLGLYMQLASNFDWHLPAPLMLREHRTA
jgi:glycosyltransferase involved in cell wall biosynthesis